jgi:hypothetical protein
MFIPITPGISIILTAIVDGEGVARRSTILLITVEIFTVCMNATWSRSISAVSVGMGVESHGMGGQTLCVGFLLGVTLQMVGRKNRGGLIFLHLFMEARQLGAHGTLLKPSRMGLIVRGPGATREDLRMAIDNPLPTLVLAIWCLLLTRGLALSSSLPALRIICRYRIRHGKRHRGGFGCGQWSLWTISINVRLALLWEEFLRDLLAGIILAGVKTFRIVILVLVSQTLTERL